MIDRKQLTLDTLEQDIDDTSSHHIDDPQLHHNLKIAAQHHHLKRQLEKFSDLTKQQGYDPNERLGQLVTMYIDGSLIAK